MNQTWIIYPFSFLPSANIRNHIILNEESKIIEKGLFLKGLGFNLRLMSPQDKKILKSWYKDQIHVADFDYPYESEFVLDNKADSALPIRFQIALRLLKSGRVYLTHYFAEKNFSLPQSPIPPFPQYQLHFNELGSLFKIFKQVSSIPQNDVKTVALYYFNNSYNYFSGLAQTHRLVDLMISSESLFCPPEIRSQKGVVIGKSASLLLGENEEQRKEIFADFVDGYTFRNKYVHGLDMSKIHRKIKTRHNNLETFVNQIESHLRKAFIKLM